MNSIEEDNQLIKKYKLSKKEHNMIYEVMKKMIFNTAKRVENPIAVIVGAQPGSGKGSLIGYSKKLYPNNNALIITTDDYKPFHPKAGEISKKYPTLYSRIVEADSSIWTSKILQEAIQNKYNFIFEVTLKNERILERMKELKENGYTVIVRVLAVSYIESLLSAFERYEKQVQIRSWGRFFDPLSYNYTYQNIPNTVETIEKSEYCDALEIYKRGKDIKYPEIIYATYTKEYRSKYPNMIFLENNETYHTAKKAIIKCRNEELENMVNIRERFDKLKDSFERRKLTKGEIEGLKILEEIIKNY